MPNEFVRSRAVGYLSRVKIERTLEREEPKTQSFYSIADWLPLALILAGYALSYAGRSYAGILTSTGFFCYGILGLIVLAKKGYFRAGASTPWVKTIVLIAIPALTIASFFFALTLWVVLMLVLLDRLVLSVEKS